MNTRTKMTEGFVLRAMEALEAYNNAPIEEIDVDKDIIASLVTDLRHLSDKLKINWEDVLWLAADNYVHDAETQIRMIDEEIKELRAGR